VDIAQARPSRRHRRPPMAHPVSEAAQRHVRLRLVTCRCPDAPCQLHPFAFDMERLLHGKPW
jgi:hypothetical protein